METRGCLGCRYAVYSCSGWALSEEIIGGSMGWKLARAPLSKPLSWCGTESIWSQGAVS